MQLYNIKHQNLPKVTELCTKSPLCPKTDRKKSERLHLADEDRAVKVRRNSGIRVPIQIRERLLEVEDANEIVASLNDAEGVVDELDELNASRDNLAGVIDSSACEEIGDGKRSAISDHSFVGIGSSCIVGELDSGGSGDR
jgi:hypothetical protein